MNFTLNATGSVARTVRSKLSDLVAPEDFGAVGDGSTDDTTNIQEFFDHLAANGGIGVLGKKTYKITTQITLTTPASGFSVFGSGPESVIALRAASNVAVFGWVTPQDILLDNFKLDCGYSVTGFSTHGWSFRNADRVTCRNLYVSDYRSSAGLTFVDADDTYGDCHFINCHADGGGTGDTGGGGTGDGGADAGGGTGETGAGYDLPYDVSCGCSTDGGGAPVGVALGLLVLGLLGPWRRRESLE